METDGSEQTLVKLFSPFFQSYTVLGKAICENQLGIKYGHIALSRVSVYFHGPVRLVECQNIGNGIPI